MIAWHNAQLLIGEGANQIRLKKKKDRNLWYAFKMDLGKKNDYLYAQSELSHTKMKLLNGRDAVTIFFKYLYQQINKFITQNNYPSTVHYSVSIPAAFEPNQRKDMMEALEFNDFQFNEQAFIDEPNAAFLSYISDPELQKNVVLSDEYNTNILVFDYGAGTCDISILDVGLDNNKFRSSNLAISRFDFIGGKEIDKLIAIDILLPQLLEENKLEKQFFTTSELKKHIIPKLERYAEQLKIVACKTISLALENINIDTYENDFYLNASIEFRTRKGTYMMARPTMSFDEFRVIMDAFTSTSECSDIQRINNNERFISIFRPVKTALTKADLTKDDIDYVLFVGGSSKNPLVQKSIKDYFASSEYLVPRDLQAHVSAGAAINSLLYNAFDEKVVAPITSEPLFLIVKNISEQAFIGRDDADEDFFDDAGETLLPIIGAGSSIPSGTVKLTSLHLSHNNQQQIELPICLTDAGNILYNLIIPCDGVSTSDKIELKVTLDANRTIHATVKVKDHTKKAVIQNALFSPSSCKERIEKAEYEYSKWLVENKGKDQSNQLYKLYKLYEAEGELLKTAEIAEELNKHHNRVSLNNIGLLYSDAGDREKAIYYYEKSLETEKSATVYFNLACKYNYIDSKKYLGYLKKSLEIDPDFGLAKYKILQHEVNNDERPNTKEKIKALFEEWESDYEANIFPYHHNWLSSCARLAGSYDFARKIEKELDNNHVNSDYNSNNLAQLTEEV